MDTKARERALVIALLASLVLWNLPFGGLVLYPFKLFATWLHELSHGLSIRPEPEKMGVRAAGTASLVFEQCRVPASLRLGEEAGCYESSFQRICVPRR